MSTLSGIYTQSNRVDSTLASDTRQVTGNGDFKLSGVQPGQTIAGKIVDVNSQGVAVDIGNGKIINAKLDGNMELQPGQTVIFTLKSTSGSQITLSPLYTNLANEATATKALMAASLPINDASLAMTSAMMDAGMSIGKQSLGEMYHIVGNYPGQDVTSLVQMNKLGLEINQNNIEQFSAYKNYENQITSTMNQLMDEIPMTYKALIQEGSVQEAGDFLQAVIRTFTAKEGTVLSLSAENMQSMAGTGQGVAEPMASLTIDRETGMLTESNGGLLTGREAKSADGVIISQEQLQNIAAGEEFPGSGKEAADVTQMRAKNPLPENGGNQEMVSDKATMRTTDYWQNMPATEKAVMVDLLRQAGLGETACKQLQSDTASTAEFLQMTQTLLAKGEMNDALKELVSGGKFGDLLKHQMQGQWLLAPIDVERKETVDSLYQRLHQQTKSLTENLAGILKPDNAFSQNLSQMNQNLDFMHQMNQVYQYVQLPLKMSGSEATGDLFVYTDKKSLAEQKGSVSALLHLDMKHLGPVDVYASISAGNSVYTKFYLESEELLDFVERHIYMLNERLEKRGYNTRCETVLRDKERKAANPVAEHDNGTVPKLMGKYSFDVRA